MKTNNKSYSVPKILMAQAKISSKYGVGNAKLHQNVSRRSLDFDVSAYQDERAVFAPTNKVNQRIRSLSQKMAELNRETKNTILKNDFAYSRENIME